MSLHTVHLVRCDRCLNAEHIPLHSFSQERARADAKANGWTRICTSTRYEDACPACTAKATPTT